METKYHTADKWGLKINTLYGAHAGIKAQVSSKAAFGKYPWPAKGSFTRAAAGIATWAEGNLLVGAWGVRECSLSVG